ncbi:MAG: hypothetical protein HQK53_08150 [Oligoflexia bacterium]|nr:hypothetical protein [Oligoflexia bacterium]
MGNLKQTLLKSHQLMTDQNIDHALIGGLALATLGINRATSDVDMLIDHKDRENLIKTLLENGFTLIFETAEVLHFIGLNIGLGKLDISLAKRPISKQMLLDAVVFPQHGIKCLGQEDIIGLKIQAYSNDNRREFQDKADILSLIENGGDSLNWSKIKMYADLFNEWPEIEKIRNRAWIQKQR